MKELLFRRFSLLGGLLALASILILSYLYYLLQISSPFVYEQVISNLYEYRQLDSKVNFEYARDNLKIQQSLIMTTRQELYKLSENKIKIPNLESLDKIETSLISRMRFLSSCAKGAPCDIEEWNHAREKSYEASETILAYFNILKYEQEVAWAKNLRRFYILSVMFLLSTLIFAAKRAE